jgi:nucleoside-diphosphate-sugar epimerase
MQFVGRLDAPHSFSFVPDAGRAMAILGTSELSWGQIWIPPVQSALSQAQFGAAIWAAAGRAGKPRMTALSRAVATPLGLVVPIVRALLDTMSHFEHPYVVDSSKFETTFGVAATPLDETIAKTIDWYRKVA